MKFLAVTAVIVLTSLVSVSQDHAKQIYDTERSFERAVAEKGINAGFIEYMSPVGVMFAPDVVNGRDLWRSRPTSQAALTWNPVRIEVSSNGALGYSVGNSIYRPKGKHDTNEFHGHYLSVWARQPNGDYRAALDTGIDHQKPTANEAGWMPGQPATTEANEKKLFAGDSSIPFFRLAENRGMIKAYKSYAAEDIYLMRENTLPFVGRDAAMEFLEDQKLAVRFSKRRSFIEAGDLAYVYSGYTLLDKNGVEKERGNFVQVWKFRGGRWQIAADVFKPIPPPKN